MPPKSEQSLESQRPGFKSLLSYQAVEWLGHGVLKNAIKPVLQYSNEDRLLYVKHLEQCMVYKLATLWECLLIITRSSTS